MRWRFLSVSFSAILCEVNIHGKHKLNHMNNKLTLPVLAKALSVKTGHPRKLCDDFIRELFATVSDVLANGESVKVRGLGTFRVVDVEQRKSVNVVSGEEYVIPEHRKVAFTPAKSLAEAVNYPFSMFEAVELSDTIDPLVLEGELPDDDASKYRDAMPASPPDDTMTVNETDEENQSGEANVTVEINGDVDAGESLEVIESVEINEPADTAVVDETPELPEVTEIGSHERTEALDEGLEAGSGAYGHGAQVSPHSKVVRRCRFSLGFLTGFLCALLTMAIGYSAYYLIKVYGSGKDSGKVAEITVEELPGNTNPPQSEGTLIVEPVDSIPTETGPAVEKAGAEEEVDTKPSDEPVYDVITKTRYLTTMARDHYGNNNFWPYIYEENKKILGHPDRIRPGTRVVVPPLSKYGVDVHSPADIRKAKNKGVEIYNRYK